MLRNAPTSPMLAMNSLTYVPRKRGSLAWPDRYFLHDGAYRLEIYISAYSEKGSGPKLKPYSFCHVPRCRFIGASLSEPHRMVVFMRPTVRPTFAKIYIAYAETPPLVV